MSADQMHVHQFKETVVPPTCRENGYTLYSCSCGYAYKTNYKPGGAHAYQIVETRPATCGQAGTITSVCSACGERNTRTVPPLGHDYGDWAVAVYPTCLEPGRRVRKCRRCSAEEENTMNPTGHRCSPENARYVKGTLVDFFCVNCGQVVRCEPAIAPAAKKTGGAWPARIVMLLAVIAAMLAMLLKSNAMREYEKLFNGVGVPFVYWLPILPVLAVALCSVVSLLAAGRIQKNARYPRWLGILTLAYGLCVGFVLVMDTMRVSYGIQQLPTDVLLRLVKQMIMVCYAFALTAAFFSGAEKKTWLFVVMLVCTVVLSIVSGAEMALRSLMVPWSYMYQPYSAYVIWNYFSSFVETVSEILFLLGLALLAVPDKSGDRRNGVRI